MYQYNVILIRSYQNELEKQADLLRINYYQTLVTPTQGEINAAKQAGYQFGKNIELDAGWSYRKDPGNDGTGTQDHVHVFGPNGAHWSQNKDGSIHDKGKNSPGEPPKWVKKDIKKKGRWDWDENKAKSNQYDYDPHYEHYYPEDSNNQFIPIIPVFPRIIII